MQERATQIIHNKLAISVDYKEAVRRPVVPLHSVQNVINSRATVGAVAPHFQSGWKPEKGQRCVILQQIIRPLTRCSSILGRPFVSPLEALFVASTWHFVFARVFGSFPDLLAERQDELTPLHPQTKAQSSTAPPLPGWTVIQMSKTAASPRDCGSVDRVSQRAEQVHPASAGPCGRVLGTYLLFCVSRDKLL